MAYFKLSLLILAILFIALSSGKSANRHRPHRDRKYLLNISDGEFKAIRSRHMCTLEKITKDMTNITEWVKKGHHFSRSHRPDQKWLEHMYMMSDGNIEETERRLKTAYRAKRFNPLSRHGQVDKLLADAVKSAKPVTLPKLTEDYGRVVLIKILDTPIDQVNYTDYFTLFAAILNYRCHNDYSLKDIYLYDLTYMDEAKLDKFLGEDLTNIANYVGDSIGVQSIDNVLFLNGKNGISEKFLKKSEKFIVPEIFVKLHIYKDFDAIQHIVPRELLPSDYGGMQDHSDDIFDDWTSLLHTDEVLEWFKVDDEDTGEDIIGSDTKPSATTIETIAKSIL